MSGWSGVELGSGLDIRVVFVGFCPLAQDDPGAAVIGGPPGGGMYAVHKHVDVGKRGAAAEDDDGLVLSQSEGMEAVGDAIGRGGRVGPVGGAPIERVVQGGLLNLGAAPAAGLSLELGCGRDGGVHGADGRSGGLAARSRNVEGFHSDMGLRREELLEGWAMEMHEGAESRLVLDGANGWEWGKIEELAVAWLG